MANEDFKAATCYEDFHTIGMNLAEQFLLDEGAGGFSQTRVDGPKNNQF